MYVYTILQLNTVDCQRVTHRSKRIPQKFIGKTSLSIIRLKVTLGVPLHAARKHTTWMFALWWVSKLMITVSLPKTMSMYGKTFIIGSLKNCTRNGADRFMVKVLLLLAACSAIARIDSGLTVSGKLCKQARTQFRLAEPEVLTGHVSKPDINIVTTSCHLTSKIYHSTNRACFRKYRNGIDKKTPLSSWCYRQIKFRYKDAKCK